MTTSLKHSVRTGLVSIFFAAVGFSYALATSRCELVGSNSAALPIVVGTNNPVVFTTPFVSGGRIRDLGDAIAGNALTRLVRARGGIAQYNFSTTDSAQLTSASLNLFTNGVVTTAGTPSTPPNTTGPFLFPVTVSDSAGFGTMIGTQTETFSLTFVNTDVFRFANDTIADGVQYQPYSAQLQTINGKQPVTYYATGLPVGLSMSSDGAVYGIPAVSGTFQFTANARDASNKAAADRSGAGIHQSVSITIAPNRTFNGILAASSITVQANHGAGKDGLSYKGKINLGAAPLAALEGKPFSIRVGPFASADMTFNLKGQAVTTKGLVPAVKSSIAANGVVSAGVGNATINLNGVTGTTYTMPVEIRAGDVVIGAECITFKVRNSGKGVTLTFNGSQDNDYGGAAQVFKVTGMDDNGGTADAWNVSFIARIPTAVNADVSTSVDLWINSQPVDGINLIKRGSLLYGASPRVKLFVLNLATGLGRYQTLGLPTALTGIPTAGKSPKIPAYFMTGLGFKNNMNPVCNVVGSLSVTPKGAMWTSE